MCGGWRFVRNEVLQCYSFLHNSGRESDKQSSWMFPQKRVLALIWYFRSLLPRLKQTLIISDRDSSPCQRGRGSRPGSTCSRFALPGSLRASSRRVQNGRGARGDEEGYQTGIFTISPFQDLMGLGDSQQSFQIHT